MRSFNIVFLTVGVLAAALAPTFGQVQQINNPCFDHKDDQTAADFDSRIAECLKTIGDSKVAAQVRAGAYLRRALAYAQKSELSTTGEGVENAIADLSEGMRLDPNNSDVQIYALELRAGLYLRKADYDRALTDWTAIIAVQPKVAKHYGSRGLAYARKGDQQRAIGDFTEAIRLDPKVALFYGQRGRAYLTSGKAQQALPDLTRALELQPNDPAFYVTRALVLRTLGRSTDAMTDVRKAAALDPASEIAKTLRQLESEHQVAERAKRCLGPGIDQAADLDKRIGFFLSVVGDSLASPNIRAEAYLRRALAYAERSELADDSDDIDRAIADLAEGQRLDPTNSAAQIYALQMRAGLYFRKADYDRALADYTTLLGRQPDAAIVHGYRATVYAAKGDHGQAIADFTEAIRRQPNTAGLYSQRALSYLKAGRPADALADADRAVAIAPKDAASYSARVVVNRAAGKTADVIGDLRKALSLDPSNEAIKNELGVAEAAQTAAAAKAAGTGADASNSTAAARRDYELSASIATRAAWEAYLKQYQTGFYADLARAQLAKLAGTPASESETAERQKAEKERLSREQAERQRTEAERLAREQAERQRLEAERLAREKVERERAEKERVAREQAEQQRLEAERLAREKVERERAEKGRVAREQAERQHLEAERLAREKVERERVEKERVAREQAERQRLEAEKVAREKAERERVEKERVAREQAERERIEKARIAREQAEQDRLEKERVAHEQAERERLEKERIARERAEQQKIRDNAAAKQKMTELTPPQETPVAPAPSRLPADGALVEEIKKELKRVGCYAGPIDDKWTTAQTGTSIKKFVKAVHASVTPDQPTTDFLDELRRKSEHVCPLECGAREVESDGKCVAKTCASGLKLDDDGDCAKQKDRSKKASRAASSGSYNPYDMNRRITMGGMRTCGPNGCQTVPKGCQAIRGMRGGGGMGGRIVCP